VAQLNYGLKAVKIPSALIRSAALGGTAVQTNTPAGYDVTVAKYIAEFTGHPVTAENKFEGSYDVIESHGALK
jgi:fumarate hydratase class II